MRRERLNRVAPLVTVFCAGMASTVAQILILRELLVLFHGNELSSGLFFFCWLVWTAVGCAGAGYRLRVTRRLRSVLSTILLLSGLALPAAILFIRASRPIWSLPVGEMASLPLMVSISLLATLLPCTALGGLFSCAWSAYARSAPGVGGPPIRVYVGEALGAAVGGAVFHFLLLPDVHPLRAALVTSSILVALAGGHLFLSSQDGRRSVWQAVLWGLVAVSLLGAALTLSSLNATSHRWQWGDRIAAVRDTPFHNLALIEEGGLYSVFGNGLWYFSAPDSQSAELSTHLALLQHDGPRTALLIGGGVSGLIPEIFKHRDVGSVDYVEPDPELIVFARRLLPEALTDCLVDPRVRVIHEDAGSFLKRVDRRYDVILLSVGEPSNLGQNRYFTVEFFRVIKEHLSPEGVFSFALGMAPDMIGPAQSRLMKSLTTTLQSVFADARVVLGGEGARFLASVKPNGIEMDPLKLIERMRARGLALSHLNEAALQDLFSPFRAQYVDFVLQETGDIPPNEDFKPVCTFQSLLVWSAQVHPGLQDFLLRMSSKGLGWLALWIAGFAGLATVVLRASRTRWGRNPGVGLSVVVVGGAQMVLQLSLILGFQILEGFVYTELAIIVSCFMVGIALGSAFFARFGGQAGRPRFCLALVQLTLMAHLVGCMMMLLFHSDRWTSDLLSPARVFPFLSLIAGILGGLHYSLAVRLFSGSRSAAPEAWVGGGLYALDLLGAAFGAMAAALILVPVYGLITTGLVALALLGVSLVILGLT